MLDNLETVKAPAPVTKEKSERGLHILADFYNCSPISPLLTKLEALQSECRRAVHQSGLNELNHIFHKFPNSGITGVILLSESHFAIHTWPEKDYLTLDIFVCNFFSDNTEKAIKLYNLLKELFQPKNISFHEIHRD